jgi:hypothetical protein
MLRLLECVNGDPTNFLPQISINSANRVLENLDLIDATSTSTSNLNNNNASLVENSSFKNLCDLLSINQLEQQQQQHPQQQQQNFNSIRLKDEQITDQNIKQVPLTPPISPPVLTQLQQVSPSVLQLTPTRVSMRLIKKKSFNDDEILTTKPKQRANSRNNNNNNKRKRSIDLDNEEKTVKILSRAAPNSADNSSNEDSLDMSNSDSNGEFIYYNNDEDDHHNVSDDGEEDDLFFADGTKRCSKRRSSLLSNSNSSSADPVKKESNKEAATRYRLKKLSEKDKLFETRIKLEKENDNVKKRIELVQTEISYLKTLLVQMLLTKGVINSSNFAMV